MAVPFPVVMFTPKDLQAELVGTDLNCYQTYPDAPDEVLAQVEDSVKSFFPDAVVTVDSANKKVSFTVSGVDRAKALLYSSQLFGLVMLSES